MAAVELSLVVAMDRAGAIGVDGSLPWHLPDDLRWFKQISLGKPVLMGRATAASIGRALPGRLNLVLSRQTDPAPFAGQVLVGSLEQAVGACQAAGNRELMVIGGGQVYALCLAQAARIFVSRVDTQVPHADTFFPPLDLAQWREVSRQHHPADDRHAWAFDMLCLERAVPQA
ncbi:dihydrofolate reductase [Frateuria aurantia]